MEVDAVGGVVFDGQRCMSEVVHVAIFLELAHKQFDICVQKFFHPLSFFIFSPVFWRIVLFFIV